MRPVAKIRTKHVALLGAGVAVAVLTAGLPSVAPAAASPSSPVQPPTVAVHGTLLPVDSDGPGEPAPVVRTDTGLFVPVSLGSTDAPETPRSFTGSIAIDDRLRRTLAADGVTVHDGQQIADDTRTARAALTAAAHSAQAAPVTTATIGAAPVRTATTATTHRLYVAVITNRGTLDSRSTIASDISAIRSFWQTEAGARFTSFAQPMATDYYASSAAGSVSDGCGLANPSAVWNEAAGRFPGVNFDTQGTHLMVIVSSACSGSHGAGIGTVGSSLASGGATIVTLGDTAVAVGTHEVGHNLSLEHANARRCASTCTVQEYFDLYSIMGLAVSGGGWGPPSLDTARRVQDGLTTPGEVRTVSTSTTIGLSPRGGTSGTRGLIVTAPGSGTRYAVDFRSGGGRDSGAFYRTGYSIGSGYVYRPGVVVERLESDQQTSLMTQASGGRYLTSYMAGQQFVDGALRITVSSMSSTSATVSITTGPPRFAGSAPSIVGTARVGSSLSASAADWGPSGTHFAYQWYSAGRAVPRATSSHFVPGVGQVSRRLAVRVTAALHGYPTTSRLSRATAAVAPGLLRVGHVVVHGRAKVGRTVHAAAGTWSPHAAFSYRWYASGRPIKKAAGTSLKVTRKLRGKTISVRVTGHAPGYTTATRSSGRTARVR